MHALCQYYLLPKLLEGGSRIVKKKKENMQEHEVKARQVTLELKVNYTA